MHIQHFRANNATLLKKFYCFSSKLYSNNCYYVNPLKIQLLGHPLIKTPGILSVKHPFHEEAEIHFFILLDQNRPLARIACYTLNNNSQWSGVGFFGFFESIHSYAAFKYLFDYCMDWFKKKSVQKVMGPFNFSQEQSLGILIKGFDRLVSLNMPYTMDYYPEFFDRYGFAKEKDLLSYDIDPTTVMYERRYVRMGRIVDKVRRKHSVHMRAMNFDSKQGFANDIKNLVDIYNGAWKQNWAFSPIKLKDMLLEGEALKLFADPKLIQFFYVRSEIAGMFICLPNINQVLKPSKANDWAQILRIFLKRRKITAIRFWALGILDMYRGLGLESLMYYRFIEMVEGTAYKTTEASWVLEDNQPMNKAMQSLMGKQVKTWRVYKYTNL